MNVFMNQNKTSIFFLVHPLRKHKKRAAVSLEENIRGMFPLAEAWFPLVVFPYGQH